jgi:hypothetical protein
VSDSEPAMVWMPLMVTDGAVSPTLEEAEFIFVHAASPARAAIVGDAAEEACWESPEALREHALDSCWQLLLDSVNRRDLQPAGEWTLLLAPRGYDWRQQVADDVVSRIDADLLENPDLRVLYVAEIIDSGAIHDIWPKGRHAWA